MSNGKKRPPRKKNGPPPPPKPHVPKIKPGPKPKKYGKGAKKPKK